MRALAILVSATLIACLEPAPATLDLPNASPAVFREKVYPVLLADCGFTTCHGNRERFFSVFGPGRTRLDPDTPLYDPVTPYELAHSYTRAESMLAGPHGPRDSLLLRKPVPLADGGAGHKGDDLWGYSVYKSTNDPHYVALYQWATAGLP